MKKIILIALLLSSMDSMAQNMVNGFFANSGNALGSGCDYPSTYITDYIPDGSILNWFRAFGVPYIATYGGTPNYDNISFRTANGLGAGIVGGYKFLSGKLYAVDIGISACSNLNYFHVEARQGARPQNTDCWDGVCGGELGYPHQGLYPYAIGPSQQILPGVLSIHENAFLYTPNNDYDWVMAYMLSEPTDCTMHSMYLDHILVSRLCQDEFYISEFSPTIPVEDYSEPYYTNHYRRIFVGSTYGSSPIADMNGRGGQIVASESILFSPNTLIAPTGENAVIAFINVQQCAGITPHDIAWRGENNDEVVKWYAKGNDAQISTQTKNEHNLNNHNGFADVHYINASGNRTSIAEPDMATDEISIFPNPTSGTFSVRVGAGNYDMTIANSVGTIVCKKGLGSGVNVISVKESLPSGVYTVYITGNNIKHIEKLVISY